MTQSEYEDYVRSLKGDSWSMALLAFLCLAAVVVWAAGSYHLITSGKPNDVFFGWLILTIPVTYLAIRFGIVWYFTRKAKLERATWLMSK